MVTTTRHSSSYSDSERQALEISVAEEDGIAIAEDATDFAGVGEAFVGRDGRSLRPFQIAPITHPPAFVTVYDRKGMSSQVRRLELGKYLQKQGKDGQRVFFLEAPAGVNPPAMAETCDYAPCTKRMLNKKAKLAHMKTYHPQEYEADHEEESLTEQEALKAMLDQMTKQGVTLESLVANLATPSGKGKGGN